MLRIRLSRRGAKKDPHYRVVVSDQKSPRDGKFVEVIGFYNPAMQPVRLHLKMERVDYWLGHGAQPSDTVRGLINRFREMSPDVTEAEVKGSEAVSEKEEAASAPEEAKPVESETAETVTKDP